MRAMVTLWVVLVGIYHFGTRGMDYDVASVITPTPDRAAGGCWEEGIPVVASPEVAAMVQEDFERLPLKWRCFVAEHATEIREAPHHPKDPLATMYQLGTTIYVVPSARGAEGVPPDIERIWWASGFVHEAAHMKYPDERDHCRVNGIELNALADMEAPFFLMEAVVDYDCER